MECSASFFPEALCTCFMSELAVPTSLSACSQTWIKHTNKQYLAVRWCNKPALHFFFFLAKTKQKKVCFSRKTLRQLLLLVHFKGGWYQCNVALTFPRYQQPCLTELCNNRRLLGASGEGAVLAKSGSFSKTSLLLQKKSPSSPCKLSHIQLKKTLIILRGFNAASAQSTVLLYHPD